MLLLITRLTEHLFAALNSAGLNRAGLKSSTIESAEPRARSPHPHFFIKTLVRRIHHRETQRRMAQKRSRKIGIVEQGRNSSRPLLWEYSHSAPTPLRVITSDCG